MAEHDRVKQTFAEAMQLPRGERRDFIAQACEDDEELRSELDAMLSAAEGADDAGFFASPTQDVDQGEPTVHVPITEGPGAEIDKYKLLQQIGEGGFGVVYMAEQREPVQRKVALKIIKLGMDTKQVIARFEAERQALAMMDHPNIAKVLDAGATSGGRPYFVMELVKGEPITEYCDKHNLSVNERLALFQQVCHAVQHAHQKGVIHRDLKPSNVMITLHDGKPVPKVIDFGIAKATNARLTERTIFTEYRQFIGTPEYMSPEQAEMSGLDIDTRSDVYALGVLLYELLTGTTPFDGKTLRSAGYGEIQRIIREEMPHKPSTRLSTLDTLPSVAAHRHTEPKKLGLTIRGDLDWIVMKALEKDRQRRYETANGFAMDIERYLRSEPVTATPPSASYKLRKFIKRNRGQVIAGGIVAVALILAVVGTSAGMVWALNERERVTQQAGRASAALRQVTDELGADLSLDPGRDMGVPIVASSAGGEVEALARTAVNLVHSIDMARKETQREATVATSVSDFVITLFEVSDPGTARGAEITAREMLDRGAERIRSELTDQPKVQARLMDVMGNVYQNLGLFEEAEELLREALERRREIHGPDGLEVAETTRKLAWNAMRRGESSQAEELYRDVVRITGMHYPADSAEFADALSHLAGPIVDLGRYEEARKLYDRVLHIRRNDPATTDEQLAGSLHNLAIVLRLLGELDESISMLKEAAVLNRRTFGDDHHTLATNLTALGLTLRDAGRAEEARPHLREALDIAEQIWGPDNANTGTFANNLALVLHELGDLDEAETMFRRVVEIDRATLSPDHPYLATSLDNLAVLLHDQRRYDDAELFYEEALHIRRSKYGEEHQETAISLNNLAVLAKDRGDLQRAETMFRESLRIRRELYPAPHAQIAVAMTNLADVLVQQDRFDEAEELYRDGLEMRTAALGEAHPAVADSMVRLAQVLERRGERDEADSLYRNALELQRRVLPPNHFSMATTLEELASIEKDAARFAHAEAKLIEAQRIHEKVFGVGDAQTLASVEELIDLYESWHVADPDVGAAAKANAWRAKAAAVHED